MKPTGLEWTTADHLQAAADALRRNEFGLWPEIHPSRSMKRRADLAAEVELQWLDPQGLSMAWLRESFPYECPEGSHVRALTLNRQGRVVRAFTASDAAIAAYGEGLREGITTCPLEAVVPWTIAVGEPALPAHALLLPALWANLAAAEGMPVDPPVDLPGLADAEAVVRAAVSAALSTEVQARG